MSSFEKNPVDSEPPSGDDALAPGQDGESAAPTSARSGPQRAVAAVVGTVFAAGVIGIAGFGVVSLWRLLDAADRALANPTIEVDFSAESDSAEGSSSTLGETPTFSVGSVSVGSVSGSSVSGGSVSVGSTIGLDDSDAGTDLVWSVMAVPVDETLSVRRHPAQGAESVDEIRPPARGLEVTGVTEQVNNELWREVQLDAGGLGWVPARFVTAQPRTWDEAARGDELLDETRRLWAMLSNTTPRGDDYLAPAPSSGAGAGQDFSSATPPRISSTGVWFGGIGVMGDVPTPLAHLQAGPLRDRNGWLDRHDFSPDATIAEFCGGACLASPQQFLDLPAWDRDGVRLIIDDLDRGASTTHGHVAVMQAMHSVTIDVPATNSDSLDWRRIHVWFDFSEGQARIVGLYTWGASVS